MAASAGVVLYDLAVLFLAAKVGGEVAKRLGAPSVLGELVAGLLLSAGLLGGVLHLPDLTIQEGDGERASTRVAVLEALAGFGAILLLFDVGLESRLREMRKVGASSLLVAVIGIVASFAIGFAASWALARAWPPWTTADAALPVHLLHIFVGAALTATSVGITARVLADLGQVRSPEARIILGAAVLDDVGGLAILAVVAALADAAIGGGAVDALGLVRIVGVALLFLVAAVGIGVFVVPRAFDWIADRVKVTGTALVVALSFALAMAYAASKAGLADIVGAFAAGLVLAESRHAPRLIEDVRAVSALFVGLFFVVLGMRIDVGEAAANLRPVLAIGLGLTLLAILGKLACGWGVVRAQADRLLVGIGMVPRGEVGLLFAGLGLATGLVANWQYAALLVMVFLTTLATPIGLQRLQGRFTPSADDAQEGPVAPSPP